LTYFGEIGLAIAVASLCSMSSNFSQPIDMAARSFERTMPETTGVL